LQQGKECVPIILNRTKSNIHQNNMELIKVQTDATGQSVVSARDLHTFLEVQTRFNDWIKIRIKDYDFIQNQDYTLVTEKIVTNNPKNPTSIQTDYAITLNVAKELAMVERNDKGKQARQYFIDCERKLQAIQKSLTPTEALLASVQRLVDIEREQLLTNKRLDKLEAEINNVSEEHYSLEGYYGLRKWKWNMTLPEAQEKGRKLKALSGVMNCPVNKCHSVQYGEKNAYHKTVLDKYFDTIVGKS
jgi:anti-repressor protein